MKRFWSGDISLDSGQAISDITLAAEDNGQNLAQVEGPLHFLSVVETARVPLHMTVGRPLQVRTNNTKSLAWFSSILLGHHEDQEPNASGRWWASAQTDSPLGVLVATGSSIDATSASTPRVTELLFFASRENSPGPDRPPTPPQSSPLGPGIDNESQPEVKVFALPLSSQLLAKSIEEPTPPPSPTSEAVEVEARFLPSPWDQQVHEPPVRKRKSAADTLNEADERRRKNRRRGGEGVAAAAAPQNRPDDAMPTLKHCRSESNTQVPIVTRPLSRASSLASIRPISRREPSVPALARPSTLSQSQSAPVVPQAKEEVTLEQKNKEFITKMTMNGMRMKGLQQSKRRRSRANSTAASPAVDTSFDEIEDDRRNDEEYKLIYHQVHKGTCFTFRQHMASVDLHMHINAVVEAITQLLGLFLQDPLAIDEKTVEDDFTPGGRKLFGSSAARPTDDRNPFLQATVMERDSKANTPCSRKENVSSKFAT